MRASACLLCSLLLACLSPLHAQQADNEGFLPVQEGVRLAYRIIGTGSDVLIVPGGYSSLVTDFSPLAKGRRLVLYDQRGRGHSDPVRDFSHVGIDYEVHDLEAVRQHFHAERVSLLRCSYLGGVVALYALEYPEHVERVIQVDPIAPRRELAKEAEKTLNGKLDKMAVDRLKRMQKAGLGKTDPVQLCRENDNVLNPAYFGGPSAAAKYHTDCELKNEQLENVDKNLDAIDRSLGDWDWRLRLKQVKVPVLLIYGTRDWIPESAAREWVQELPNARLLSLPGVGHISWFERSDLVFAAADSFLHGAWPNGAIAMAKE
jgi:proline iminopeptidase